MFIVENSDRIIVSPVEHFLLWDRIFHMIDALFLIVMASRVTQEKALMESMILMRSQNSGIV